MTKDPSTTELLAEIEKLSLDLAGAREREKRAVADYQNLVRRSAEERIRIAKIAALDFVEALLEPLSHLSLASEQLKDQGLSMIVNQLWQRLNDAGLEEINPLDEPFDVETMEAVADPSQTEVGAKQEKNGVAKVVKVVAKGYRLGGEVVRHAKVLVK